jgi:hypothetical protein
LESILLDSNGNHKATPAPNDNLECVYHASLLLAKELQPRDGKPARLLTPGEDLSDRYVRRNCDEDTEFLFWGSIHQVVRGERPPQKRKRSLLDHESLEQTWNNAKEEMVTSALPSTRVLDRVVDAFFSIVHPWIPFLHQSRFKEQLEDPQKQPGLEIILHALVSATMKHLKEEDVGMSRSEMAREVRISRNVVMLTAMDNLTIENIQALIVVAFYDVASHPFQNI